MDWLSLYPSFAVLLAVWAGDRPDFLRRAFRSVVDEQTVCPDQLVLVQDGPVGAELRDVIAELSASSTTKVTVVALPTNVGLGPALNAGLEQCLYDVVARMDADDISVPTRFEQQLPLIADADLVGSGLYEFTGDVDNVVGVRTPPIGTDAIVRYARLHDPFNHPTVVYRRSAVAAAGGYSAMALMEDYALFARMIASGARVANLADPLVYYRVGELAFRRRGGFELLRSEVRLQRQFRSEGFVGRAEFVRNVVIRGGYRLIPWWARRELYTRFVTSRSRRRAGLPGTTQT